MKFLLSNQSKITFTIDLLIYYKNFISIIVWLRKYKKNIIILVHLFFGGCIVTVFLFYKGFLPFPEGIDYFWLIGPLACDNDVAWTFTLYWISIFYILLLTVPSLLTWTTIFYGFPEPSYCCSDWFYIIW